MLSCFSSESVTCGHPDKVCDQIADRILDKILQQDMNARVACEVTCTTDRVHIFGEVTTKARVDYAQTAREVLWGIGYTAANQGFDAAHCRIAVDIHEQSPDIAMGISRRDADEFQNNGAGDQGMMFGYACRETPCLMPLPIELAHALAKKLEQVRKTGELDYLLPDGKTQVTVEYEDNIPKRIAAVIVSAQHRSCTDIETLRDDILNHVILSTLPHGLLDENTTYYVNPTGRFCLGGPAADSGLTGRKIISDTYGGYARHGGGGFSGKDATKVDRSGAYLARYLAKNVVAAGLADRCEIQLSYAIGLADPISLRVDTFDTQTVPVERIVQAIQKKVDLRPYGIITRFGLTRPIFSQLACYGHFGTNASGLPWEQTDIAQSLRSMCK